MQLCLGSPAAPTARESPRGHKPTTGGFLLFPLLPGTGLLPEGRFSEAGFG